jgi:hypothetical protein
MREGGKISVGGFVLDFVLRTRSGYARDMLGIS